MEIAKEQNINVGSIPYVIDGLIAHYDFLWNTRIRGYNNDSLIWKDLIGRNDIMILTDDELIANYEVDKERFDI